MLQTPQSVQQVHFQFTWLAMVSHDNVAADTTHYLENECMREAMETLLYDNGVDVILNGHLHEYERTNPVYVSPHYRLPLAKCW